MKQSILFIAFITMMHFVIAQNQLVSYYNSYSEVYGGMEDGGISRNEAYYFKVNATITLPDIYFNDKNLILHRGDTLVINVGKYTPYNNNNIRLLEEEEEVKQKELPAKERYKVFQKEHVYYANVQFPFIWDGTISYKYKKQTFIAKAKDGFDAGFTGAAP